MGEVHWVCGWPPFLWAGQCHFPSQSLPDFSRLMLSLATLNGAPLVLRWVLQRVQATLALSVAECFLFGVIKIPQISDLMIDGRALAARIALINPSSPTKLASITSLREAFTPLSKGIGRHALGGN